MNSFIVAIISEKCTTKKIESNAYVLPFFCYG